MKQSFLRAAVASTLIVLSSIANANNINFTEAADAIINAERQILPGSSWLDFQDLEINRWRPVALSELSNSEVSFTNASNLGIYNVTIEQPRGSDYGPSYVYNNLVSYGQNGFTADFSQPVTNVSMDFSYTDYFTWIGTTPLTLPLISSTPTILNATYRDALGNTISNSTYTLGENYNGFSLDNSTSFSSVDISWDAGTVTVLDYPYSSEASPTGRVERTMGNLLTANNFTYTQAVAVPEPETYAMMMAGLGMLGFTARRKKAKH